MAKQKQPEVEDNEEPEESVVQDDQQSYSQNRKKKQTAKKSAKISKGSNKKEAQPKEKVAKENTEKTKKKPEPKAKPAEQKAEVKEDKKKDFLPGQKYPTPDDEDGALAFYKSLYEKNPRSQMARKYCLEYGVLEQHEASKLLKETGKNKK